MINFVLVMIIVVIVGGAIAYIRKEKKRGVRCVGCPDGGTCGGNCSGCAGNAGETSGGDSFCGNNAMDAGEKSK